MAAQLDPQEESRFRLEWSLRFQEAADVLRDVCEELYAAHNQVCDGTGRCCFEPEDYFAEEIESMVHKFEALSARNRLLSTTHD